MKACTLIMLALIIGLVGATALAGDRGTPDEAKAMAIKAAKYLKDVGPDKAFAAFDVKDNEWHDRDLYVYVLAPDATVLAHGGIAGYIGKSIASLKDVDGNSIAGLINAIPDQGWAEYKWQNPVTKAIELKTSYAVKVGDDHVVVGAYK
ncbi:MAG: cache domain-containing protein [Acetobacteraceae bacterium]|jgi:signal transduction histidine kinase